MLMFKKVGGKGEFTAAAKANFEWGAPGSACVPSDTTIKFNRHRTGIGFVRHAPGIVDPVVLVCQIEPFAATDIRLLSLTYEDSNGAAASAGVRARLYLMPHESGTPVLLATTSSNTSTSTAVHTEFSEQFNHSFDFGANTYWIRVELRRSASTHVVIFHAVGLASLF
jgi:hypothetical protein